MPLPGGSAVVRRLQHSCFPDGGGVLQSGHDYFGNHDHLLYSVQRENSWIWSLLAPEFGTTGKCISYIAIQNMAGLEARFRDLKSYQPLDC